MKKITIILTTILLFSCNQLNQGYIIEKNYDTSKTYTTLEYDVILKIPTQKIHHIPEKWYITIQDTVNQDTITRKLSVSKKDFKLYNIGDYFINK